MIQTNGWVCSCSNQECERHLLRKPSLGTMGSVKRSFIELCPWSIPQVSNRSDLQKDVLWDG